MFATWWAWVGAGLVLAILEVFAPGYVFVGFAIGAVVTGAIIGLGLPGAGWLMAAPINALFVFAVMSVAAWLGMRRLLGLRRGQVKRIDRDINEG
jgi:membrane protein implicated in regulation of membrane protease activity